jgi:hypothetical protein
VIATLALAGVSVAILSASRAPALRGEGVSWQATAFSSASSSSGFAISGSVGGLWPGDSTSLLLTVSNPQHFAIAVNSISTSVGAANATCLATTLTVGRFKGSLTVPAQGIAQVSVPVSLSHSAPNGCQGAVFPLTYSGLAGKA